MRRFVMVLVLIGVTCAGPVAAEQVLREYSWATLRTEGKLANGELMTADKGTSFASLAVENAGSDPATITVLTVEDPKVTEAAYAIRGQVKYEGVEGKGCLEMWNYFPGGGRTFTRTLAAYGPMQYLEGSSGWREFSLPFVLKDNPMRPEKLVVNVVLPGKGKVFLGPLRLVQYARDEDPLADRGQWWTGRQGGLIGGIAGGLFGCLGALIGVLSSKGRAPSFVLATLRTLPVIGLVFLAAAAVALVRSQPYDVYYPLLLLGLLLVALPLGLLPFVRRRYEELELRKMKAQDILPG